MNSLTVAGFCRSRSHHRAKFRRIACIWSSLQTWSRVETLQATSEYTSGGSRDRSRYTKSCPRPRLFRILHRDMRPFSSVASYSWCFQWPNDQIAYGYIHLSRRPLA